WLTTRRSSDLQEVQVALGVLHAVIARRVVARQREAAAVAEQAVLGQQLFENLRHAEALEDAAVAPLRQPGQGRAQFQAVAAELRGAVGLLDAPDQAVQRATLAQGQPGGLAQQ